MTACAYPTCPKSGASCTVYSPKTGLPEAVYLCQEHWKEQRNAGLHNPPGRVSRQFVPGLVNDTPTPRKEPMPQPPARDLTNALADVKGGLSVNVAAQKYHVGKQRLCDACDEAGIVWRRTQPTTLPEAVKIEISVAAKPEAPAPSQVVGTSNVPDYANPAKPEDAPAEVATSRVASEQIQPVTQSPRPTNTVPATVEWNGPAAVIRVLGRVLILAEVMGKNACMYDWGDEGALCEIPCRDRLEAFRVVTALLSIRGVDVPAFGAA